LTTDIGTTHNDTTRPLHTDSDGGGDSGDSADSGDGG